MRYLIDIPLVIGVVGLWRMVDLIVYTLPPGREPGLGMAVEIFLFMAAAWLGPAIAISACAGIGGFPWISLKGGGAVFLGFVVVLGAFVVALVPIGITMEFNAQAKWGIDQVGAARVAAFGLPLALGLYAAWVVNAPAPARDARVVHYAALSVIGLLCVLSAWVSVREMARWDKESADRQVARAEAMDERTQQQRREFEALTDADPLLAWDGYVHDDVPPDIRTEALRRIALRPNLEGELADSLASGNTNWVREGLWLITRIPFRPGARLEQPVRAALGVISEEIRQRPQTDTRDGDKAVDLYETFTLRSTLGVAERMADSAGIDLSDAIDMMVRAVAVSRTSEAARHFPEQAAAAKARIAATLAARHG